MLLSFKLKADIILSGSSAIQGSASMTAQLPGNGLLNNLVAYCAFDELSASADAVDSSVNGRNLTVSGSPTSGTGLLNGCRINASTFSFSSANSGFKFGDQDFSIVGFVLFSSVSSTPVLISRYNATGNQRSYRLFLNGGQLQWDLSANGTSLTSVLNTSVTATINNWYFLAARYDSVNNIMDCSFTLCALGNVNAFQSTAQTGGALASSTAALKVLSDGAGANFTTGKVDEVAFYSEYLSNTKVNLYYNGGVPLGYPNFTP